MLLSLQSFKLKIQEQTLSAGFVGCLLLFVGCISGSSPGEAANYTSLRTEYQQLTAARDSLFRSEDSPLLEADHAIFEGLTYFPYDSTLASPICRFRAALITTP